MATREFNESNVKYDLDPAHTVLLGVDFQVGFAGDGWEGVPGADAAVACFSALADQWRNKGGRVAHLFVTFNNDNRPSGNIEHYFPDIATGLREGGPGAAFYNSVTAPRDIFIPKSNFSGVQSGNLLEVLQENGFDSAIVGGLTTPVCVQTTVDGLSMAGMNVAVLRDASASQAIGDYSAEQAHEMAIQRMGYIVAQITTTEEMLAALRSADETSLV